MEYKTQRPHSALGYRTPAPTATGVLQIAQRLSDVHSLTRDGTKSRSGHTEMQTLRLKNR